jgi:hypothetical protein
MAETNVNYVTKNEFRLVALVLVPLIVVALIVLVQHVLSALFIRGTTKSTPIVLRGGAMTAFAERSKWAQVSTTTYCLDIKTSGNYYVDFDDQADPNSSASPPNAAAVEIHGHDPTDPNKASKFGFKLVLQTVDCKGTSGHKSVQISSIGGAFYKAALPLHGTHGDNLRFLVDSSAGCASDEDLCERMAEVVVTASDGTVSTYPCLDGDCSVHIGTQ